MLEIHGSQHIEIRVLTLAKVLQKQPEGLLKHIARLHTESRVAIEPTNLYFYQSSQMILMLPEERPHFENY